MIDSPVHPYDASEFLTSWNDEDFKGRGSFACVRKCEHSKLGKVAAKCYSIIGSREKYKEAIKQIQREVEVMFRLDHKNIVQILGITQWAKNIGIIMEYVDGGNLEELLMSKDVYDIPWLLRIRFYLDLAEGLAFLHHYDPTKVFVHSDIKPQNILLTLDLILKIADFGSVNLISSKAATASMDILPSSQFTIFYAAPEVLKDLMIRKKPSMDVYSFGMVGYEILTRRQVFQGVNQNRVFQAIIDLGQKPDLRLLHDVEKSLEGKSQNLQIFKFLENITMKCWEYDAKKRPDIRSVRNEVNKKLRSLGASRQSYHINDLRLRGKASNEPSTSVKIELNKFRFPFEEGPVPLSSQIPESHITSEKVTLVKQEQTKVIPESNQSERVVVQVHEGTVEHNKLLQPGDTAITSKTKETKPTLLLILPSNQEPQPVTPSNKEIDDKTNTQHSKTSQNDERSVLIDTDMSVASLVEATPQPRPKPRLTKLFPKKAQQPLRKSHPETSSEMITIDQRAALNVANMSTRETSTSSIIMQMPQSGAISRTRNTIPEVKEHQPCTTQHAKTFDVQMRSSSSGFDSMNTRGTRFGNSTHASGMVTPRYWFPPINIEYAYKLSCMVDDKAQTINIRDCSIIFPQGTVLGRKSFEFALYYGKEFIKTSDFIVLTPTLECLNSSPQELHRPVTIQLASCYIPLDSNVTVVPQSSIDGQNWINLKANNHGGNKFIAFETTTFSWKRVVAFTWKNAFMKRLSHVCFRNPNPTIDSSIVWTFRDDVMNEHEFAQAGEGFRGTITIEWGENLNLKLTSSNTDVEPVDVDVASNVLFEQGCMHSEHFRIKIQNEVSKVISEKYAFLIKSPFTGDRRLSGTFKFPSFPRNTELDAHCNIPTTEPLPETEKQRKRLQTRATLPAITEHQLDKIQHYHTTDNKTTLSLEVSINKGHIMISYNWNDSKEVARKVKGRLGNEGYPVWIDIEQMQGWIYSTLDKAVKNASVILVFMSSGYEESENCKSEASLAKDLKKRIIPIYVQTGYRPKDVCRFVAAGKLYFDLSDESSFDEKVLEIIKELGPTSGYSPEFLKF